MRAEKKGGVIVLYLPRGDLLLILKTDDFDRDFARFKKAGVEFLEDPRLETYGKVAVFRDAFGNKWDLIEALANQPG